MSNATRPQVVVVVVSEEDAERFRIALSELAEERRGDGASYEVTGPWPPYIFVAGDEESG